ncbi:MAG: PAS domain S-box-containing protein [Cellvibrionaceae bacterium]|jgi:PAS domain S-box-containing protein
MNINEFLPAPKFSDVNKTQTSKYLNVILISTLIANPIYCLVLFYTLHNPIKPLIANSGLFLIQATSLLLLHQKQVKKASVFNIAGFWLYCSFLVFTLGGPNSPGMLGFFVVVLMAGLLLNSNWAYFFTALSITFAICVFFIEESNRLPESVLEITPLLAWGSFIVAILTLVTIYKLSTEKLNLALEATQQNVQALNEKNKLLQETQSALQNNLSELSRTESALRLSQNHLKTVVQSAPVILWTSDIKGKTTLLEGSTLSSIQITSDKFQGISIFDALGERVQGLKSKMHRVLQGETVISIENLKDRIFEIHFSPLFDEGSVNGIIGVAIDITERIQAQDAVIYLQKIESLGVLAGGIAHDFNNLLVGILGQASVSLYKMEDDHPSKKHIEKAVLAAEKAGGLTHQLLAYSGRGRFKIKAFDLNELVKENITLFQTAVSKNVNFQILLQDNPLVVDGDTTQLQQVIMNLIINGAEAIHQDTGEVIIETFRTTILTSSKETDWAGNSLVAGTYAGLKITDSGSGMTDDVLQKIFDPFFTTKKAGQGLGLAAVQGIVRGHGGSLYVSSQPDVGTTFKVLLPLANDQNPRQEVQDATSPNLSSHISTVLQIDDEESVCETLIDILATQNIKVLSALTRQQGIDLFKINHTKIDLIILDMTMPGISLKILIDQIQSINSQTPIILSSGFDREEVSSQVDTNMIHGFISKPYSIKAFITQLTQILEPLSNL